MSTTTLIVEVVIIGAQVLAWICLALIALFGARWLDLQTLQSLKDWTTPISIGLIALSYTLGIVCDTLFASFFAPWAMRSHVNPWTNRSFPASPAHMRAYVMVTHKEAFQDLERRFNQTRLLRATILNLLLVGVFASILYLQHYDFSWRGLIGALFLLAFLAGATFVSWTRTLRGYYITLGSTFEMLREKEQRAMPAGNSAEASLGSKAGASS